MSGRARRQARERRASCLKRWQERLQQEIAWATKQGLPVDDLKRMQRSCR